MAKNLDTAQISALLKLWDIQEADTPVLDRNKPLFILAPTDSKAADLPKEELLDVTRVFNTDQFPKDDIYEREDRAMLTYLHGLQTKGYEDVGITVVRSDGGANDIRLSTSSVNALMESPGRGDYPQVAKFVNELKERAIEINALHRYNEEKPHEGNSILDQPLNLNEPVLVITPYDASAEPGEPDVLKRHVYLTKQMIVLNTKDLNLSKAEIVEEIKEHATRIDKGFAPASGKGQKHSAGNIHAEIIFPDGTTKIAMGATPVDAPDLEERLKRTQVLVDAANGLDDYSADALTNHLRKKGGSAPSGPQTG